MHDSARVDVLEDVAELGSHIWLLILGHVDILQGHSVLCVNKATRSWVRQELKTSRIFQQPSWAWGCCDGPRRDQIIRYEVDGSDLRKVQDASFISSIPVLPVLPALPEIPLCWSVQILFDDPRGFQTGDIDIFLCRAQDFVHADTLSGDGEFNRELDGWLRKRSSNRISLYGGVSILHGNQLQGESTEHEDKAVEHEGILLGELTVHDGDIFSVQAIVKADNLYTTVDVISRGEAEPVCVTGWNSEKDNTTNDGYGGQKKWTNKTEVCLGVALRKDGYRLRMLRDL